MEGRLGQYHLIRPLQAQVSHLNFARPQLYLAQATDDQSLYVIKFLSVTAGQIEQELFLNEVRVLNELREIDSSYWLPLLKIGQEVLLLKSSSTPPELVRYLVLPYMEQGNIRDFLSSQICTLQQTEQLWLGMLDAVLALHKNGWLHLDLKPSNFLINAPSNVYLIDFALAQPDIKSQASNVAPKAMEATRGTPRYMSPEQFLGQQLTAQTDFYSLGLILYELLMQKSLYQANDYQGWAMQHCQQPVPLLPEHLASFQMLIDGLLAKNQHNRLNEVTEIRRLAQQAFQGVHHHL